MLEIKDLNAWYDRSHILQGISLNVQQGEIVSIIGRNGAEKTTTLRSVMGLVKKTQGSVRFEGADILGEPTHKRLARGLAYVPEDRRIVPGLTVRENLRLGLLGMHGQVDEAQAIEQVTETFPRLNERLDQVAETMSGGEQQMLAIARAAISKPRLIMLDEPSEGIMPVLVDEMFDLFVRMKKEDTTILLVEQNVEIALSISDRAYIIDQGLVVHESDAVTLLAEEATKERYCSV